jgi:hypothetical protein
MGGVAGTTTDAQDKKPAATLTKGGQESYDALNRTLVDLFQNVYCLFEVLSDIGHNGLLPISS